MKNPRLYLPMPLQAGTEIELPPEAAQHLRVLRSKDGDPLTLFNGEGGEYPATLRLIGKRDLRAQVGEHVAVERESPLAVTLLQGVSKGERMDFTMQKAVELGVRRIVPVFTERSVVQLAGERLEKRLGHWQGVIRSACEQCGRNRLPELAAAATLDEALAQPGSGLKLVLAPDGEAGLHTLRASGELGLLIGPEGGLSEAEIERAVAAGYLSLRLGPRVLRTETAGIAALAALQALAGDLG